MSAHKYTGEYGGIVFKVKSPGATVQKTGFSDGSFSSSLSGSSMGNHAQACLDRVEWNDCVGERIKNRAMEIVSSCLKSFDERCQAVREIDTSTAEQLICDANNVIDSYD